jgi:hypothetical protein
VRAQLVQAGYSVAVSTPEAFAKQLADGTKVYERIVAEAGISPE